MCSLCKIRVHGHSTYQYWKNHTRKGVKGLAAEGQQQSATSRPFETTEYGQNRKIRLCLHEGHLYPPSLAIQCLWYQYSTIACYCKTNRSYTPQTRLANASLCLCLCQGTHNAFFRVLRYAHAYHLYTQESVKTFSWQHTHMLQYKIDMSSILINITK